MTPAVATGLESWQFSQTRNADAARKRPPVWRSDDASVVHFRRDPDGIERPMIIVRYAVPAVNSNVHRVRASHEAQAVDHEPDLRVAAEIMRLRSLDIGVRAVTADPLRAEQRNPEDKVVEGVMCAHPHSNSKRLSRLEHVRGHAVATNKLDCSNLSLTRAPAALDCLHHVLGLFSGRCD